MAEPEPQAEDAAEAVGPEPEPEAKKKSVRPGRGARAARAKAKAEAAEKAAEAKEDVKGKKSALPAAKEAPALPEAAAAAAESEAGAASAAGEATAEVAPEPSSASTKEAPKKRTRRRRTKKPVEDIVVKGPEAEQLLAKEAAAVEAEAAGEAVAKEVTTQEPPVAAQTDAVANEPQAGALLAEKDDTVEAVIELAEEPAVEPAAVEPADAPAAEVTADAPAAEVTAESAADEQSNGRSGGRARVRGRGRRGLERRSRGDNLSDVPYVRRGGESETALREQIVQLDPRLWMNGWLLSHPGAFTLYERELRGIDAALQEGELPGDLTRRQLAYKMGGNEKFFEYGADGHKLLRAMGADDLIGHRLVPKADMLYHVPRRRKSMKILESVLRQMLEFNMGRGDLVIAVGGGVVGDLAGFAASIYMRGIDFINCPTTTLSMIDSSIGGKTAVDLGETKNIVGSFWQPKLVIVDPSTLATLPRRQYINGLAESVKASLLADPELFAIFEKGDIDEQIGEIIYRSLRFKKSIVEQDETEHGMRKALNFGHTIGHGIEAVKGVKGRRTVGLYHGECVALGMLPMIESKALQKRVRAVYRRLGLPLRTAYNKDKVYAEMLHDKKAQGGQITVIKVPGLGCWRAETIPVEGLRPLLGMED